MTQFRTIDQADVAGKRVLVRVDFNVPVQDGAVSDATRIRRSVPTIRDLTDRGARVILISHFGRPKDGPEPALSLRQVLPAVEEALGKSVAFADPCYGPVAESAARALGNGQVLLLENVRFRRDETTNDAAFAKELADLADLYVNDAFSMAHRAHASTEGITQYLPAYAGRAMEAELTALEKALGAPERPVTAIVGGAKVSTKIAVLENLVSKVDYLAVGGGMANTFLAAQGVDVAKSLQEADQHETARTIIAKAKETGCKLILPVDGVVAKEFKAGADARTVPVNMLSPDDMILDIGSETLAEIAMAVNSSATIVWNGPLGAFEIPPFDTGTSTAARQVMILADMGKLVAVAGGGDTVAALEQAGVVEGFSYVSAAGGAFLEWLEGKTLPGVAALEGAAK